MRHIFAGFIVILLGSFVLAESKLEIGFDGNIVANRWNPIKLTTRDQAAATLSISIDRGNLRIGSLPISYSFDIPQSYGIATFEEDIFIPKWQSFSWKLQSSEAVLASGSIDRRFANPQSLSLLISANPTKWLSGLAGRVAAVPSNVLTKRLASYDGISTIIIDGTAAAPRPDRLVAATSAGVTTVLMSPLPASHQSLTAIVPTGMQKIGAGLITRHAENEKLTIFHRDFKKVLAAYIENSKISVPSTRQQGPIFIALIVFALLIVILMWMGNKAAVMTSFSISILAIILVFNYLIPREKELQQQQSLYINSGELAKEIPVSSIFSLAGGESSINNNAYVLEPKQFNYQNGSTFVTLKRWSRVTMIHKPRLAKALLLYDGAYLENRSKQVLRDVYIKGIGFVEDLKPGKYLITKQEDRRLPDLYRGIVSGLEPNTVIAHYGNNLLLAQVANSEVSE